MKVPSSNACARAVLAGQTPAFPNLNLTICAWVFKGLLSAVALKNAAAVSYQYHWKLEENHKQITVCHYLQSNFPSGAIASKK